MILAGVKSLGLVLLLLASKAYCYPELIRHGYKSCTTCHSSVVGGDALTPYGRSLAQELLSSKNFWQSQKEPEANSGEATEDSDSRIDFGGGVRLLQTHRDSSQRSSGRFLLMQLDTDMNWNKGFWSVYSSLGRQESSAKERRPSDFVYIPRLWTQYVSSMEDPERFLFRLGKFVPGYGVNIAEHTSVNRRPLNLGPGSERLNLEVAFENEEVLLLLDLIQGRYTPQKVIKENGLLLQLVWQKIEGFRFGMNSLNLRNGEVGSSAETNALGAFAILGWNKQFSQILQLDVIEKSAMGKTLALYSKLSFEPSKGLNYFTTQEYLNEDLKLANPHFEAIGIGVQYFPIAQVDLMVNLRQEKNTQTSKEAETVLWLLGHIYL